MIGWFDRAVGTAKFPTNQAKTLTAKEHVIRLITRLLFVWFIKEKGLVADELFNQFQISGLLKDYDPETGDSYYRAVLQNLFFATLNTEMNQRGFSLGNNSTHRNFSFYRYRKEMSDPDRLLELFKKTPFINGGLFDCLDSFDGVQAGGFRIDCFTDNPNQRQDFSIPNRLFFDQGKDHEGLITIFDHYKFTVEENTPTDVEVALDPELLGKVFENLLAANTEETKESARKQTGSYYTPRPVVDYMVDEALVASLAGKVNPGGIDADWWRERLLYLLDYNDAFDDANGLFTVGERQLLVKGISSLRVLDPAVGSGAFPMGVLHKLTLALRRLDPNNDEWKSLQIDQATLRAKRAFGMASQEERERGLDDIRAMFERYSDNDFGRKLFLIQNCIYGVDIQPVATQIAKLRFFITLAIEQEPDPNAPNFGIRPLPNLETKFVAANTLLSLGQPGQLPLGQTEQMERLLEEIRSNWELHFHAATRLEKLDRRVDDKKLRQELSEALEANGFGTATAAKLAKWDPFDQKETADWFSPEYTFGVKQGFDVIVGNPPYINVENLGPETRSYLLDNYKTCERRTDIYIAFLERALEILNGSGGLCFILSSAFANQQYATKMRETMIKNHSLRELVDATAYRIFENAAVFNVVVHVGKAKRNILTRVRLHRNNEDFDNRTGTEFLVDQSLFGTLKDCRFDTNPALMDGIPIRDSSLRNSVPLGQICLISYGARLNGQRKQVEKAHYLSQRQVDGGKKFCEGHNIQRYSFEQEAWLRYRPNEHYRPVFPEVFESEKLMAINIVNGRLRFAYDKGGYYNSHTVVNCVRLDLLLHASHRSAKRAVIDGNPEQAKRFSYKYLLAVLNSRFINWYFLTFLSEGLHFYPNDAKLLPIANASPAQQRMLVRLVDHILEDKASNANVDTSELEAEIDRLIYALYGLTEEEIAVVSRKS